MRTIALLIVICTSSLLLLQAVDAKSCFFPRNLAFQPRTRSCLVALGDHISLSAVEVLRGGAAKKTTEEDEESDDDEESDEEEDDSESDVEEEEEDEEVDEDEYDVDEYDDEYDDEEEEEEEAASVTIADKGEIVEPYFVSPQLQLYSLLGSMMLAKKLDLFNPVVVKTIRFLFILQLIIQQAFIFYVRIMAKKNNDRTPIQQKNPLSEMLQKQFMDQQPGGNDMVKNLASSFLSSETTVMEYDLKQASNMQGSILFTMIFNWFLHFKMKKTQPVLTQIMSSTLQLIYHPLFQVYILGRNLERPFKTQMMMTQEKMKAAQAEAEKGKTAEDDESNTEDEEEDEDEDEESDDKEEESESEEEDSDDDDDDDDDGAEDDEEEDDNDDEEEEEDEDSSSS